MSNLYTNRMRMALRTLKNPTAIPVDIIQHPDRIELHVEGTKFDKLGLSSRMNFISYVHAMCDIIESEGSRATISGIKI